MSLAQVDLMCADVSVTTYPKTDKAKDSNGKEHKLTRPTSSSMEELKKKFDTWDGVKNTTFDISGFKFS